MPEPAFVSLFGDLEMFKYKIDPVSLYSDNALAPLRPDGYAYHQARSGVSFGYRNEKVAIGSDSYLAFENNTETGIAVHVEKNGEPIFTVSEQGWSLAVTGMYRSLWKLDESWVLEVMRDRLETGIESRFESENAYPAGEIYIDGELINEQYGYTSAFEFQVLNGKPFFFYRKGEELGFSYDWQEHKLPFDSIHHYACCSAGINKPRHYENLISFLAHQGDESWYVELVGP